MAFIIEDGSGVVGATSYATVEEYKAYFKDRGVTVTDATSVLQAALIKATDYIDTRFGRSIRGLRANQTLSSRSILTFTAQPLDTETVTIGLVTYTFRTTALIPTDIQIGANLYLTLLEFVTAVTTAENVDFLGVRFDNASIIHVFTARDGVATTETSTVASFNTPESAGFSGSEQPLEFPRLQLFDSDSRIEIAGIPVNLKRATFEYANRAVSASLLPDPTVETSGLQVTQNVTKVGPIELSTRLSEQVGRAILQPYPAADLLMADFTRNNGGTIRN